jgi:hypothetical protein
MLPRWRKPVGLGAKRVRTDTGEAPRDVESVRF